MVSHTHSLDRFQEQSVEDVECLFGAGVIKFKGKHGYKAEAEYVKIVQNWRSCR